MLGAPDATERNQNPMNFTDLGLIEPLVRAVHEHGYDTPTPIQAQAIPAVLNGGDLLGGAQTGTGKTAGFVLPMLQRLIAAHADSRARRHAAASPIRALILTPTRELAAQVEESVRTYGKYLQLTQHGDVRRRRHAAADRQAASAASTSWWPRRAACSTTTASARST